MEQWRTVVHNGETYDNYEVSTEGRVRSLNYKRTGEIRVLKPHNNGYGYLQVALNSKHIKIHRLVAETFIPNPNNYSDVNHINENKHDNRVENLEWVSHKQNMCHGTCVERSTKARSKKVICIETNTIYDSISQAYHETGIPFQNISEVCKGKRQTAGGYHWKFVD